jgi:hypothetical protein
MMSVGRSRNCIRDTKVQVDSFSMNVNVIKRMIGEKDFRQLENIYMVTTFDE